MARHGPARDDIVGLDAAIIMNPRVWEVSGHVGGFSDPMVDCRNCKLRFRADDLKGPPSEIACPNCGQRGTLTEARAVQPDVQDPRRADGGERQRRLPASRDGAGHLRQLRQRGHHHRAASCRSASRRSARASATRSRRATSSSATASSSRWRWSSSSTRREEDQWFAYWVDGAPALVDRCDGDRG